MSRENIYISGVTVKQCKTTSCSCFRAEHQWSHEDWTYLMKRHILCRRRLAFFAVQRCYWQRFRWVFAQVYKHYPCPLFLYYELLLGCVERYTWEVGRTCETAVYVPVCCFISYNACLWCAEEKERRRVCTFVSKAGLCVCAVLLH